ncbi:MAG: hypothetical protein N3D15_00155, partial [Syntrophorhabdaceae bacterium]|nr:hypothetical protein [Syntrophorhabdaceae bacterium]
DVYKRQPYESPTPEVDILSPRLFRGHIDKQWRVVSFSSLISTSKQGTELPDRDTSIKLELSEPVKKPLKGDDIFSFPSGTKAGSCLHDILEHVDFSFKDHNETKALVNEKLIHYGFEGNWSEIVFNKIKDVLNVPLKAHDEAFTLSMIDKDHRLHELEFYLPLNLMEPKRLGDIFRRYLDLPGDINLEDLIINLGFSPVEGMIRGFMDMVFEYRDRFYIVDWKSNLLGDKIEDYTTEKIKKVMANEYYFLQYHLYTVALNSLLAFRYKDYTYEKGFGGVFYLFIRGIWPDKKEDYGIFFDMPKKGLIEELTAYLKGG